MSILLRHGLKTIIPRFQPSLLAVPVLLATRLCSICAAPRTPQPQTIIKRNFLGIPSPLASTIGEQPAPDGKGTIPVVIVPDAKKIWNDFDLIVDVREKNEVDEGMIPGAIHVPLAQVLAKPDQPAFKGKKQILVYCRAGVRSAKAVQAMRKAGLDAINLGGGYLAWLGDK